MTDTTTFRLRITGDVQGVGFREWSIQQAAERKLDGWVRNRSDGTVELLISGPDRTIQDMLGACTQGPEGARVSNIDILNEKEAPASGFVRKPTL
ncbi:MAG: acylphosphatase [Micropepsaceae bacterium]